MSDSDSEREEGLSNDSDSDRTQEREDSSTSSDDSRRKDGKRGSLEHTNSLPNPEFVAETPVQPAAVQVRQKTSPGVTDRDDKTAKRKNSVSWTPFGAIGKAVGGGVQMVGSATKAVGSGMVKGTQAVGSGMVKGTQAVGSGVVSAAETVGSGVVSAAESVGSGVVSAAETVGSGVAAVGSGVVKTGEVVGSAAFSGVNAVGEATKRTACSVSRSVDDSTTWVREKRRSVILHANPYKQHRVEEGETIGIIAAKYKTTVEDILVLNKETVDEEAELQVGMMLKVPVREKRKTSRQIQSDSFLSNLSQAFKEVETGDTEQVDTRCMIISNNSAGPVTNNPECGYLIVERNVIILTWGKGNPIHLEQENIQGVNLLYGEEELVGFLADNQQSADTLSLQVVSTSFSESDVFPTCDEQPELEDSSAGTEEISPRHLKTEDSVSDELSNNGSLKNHSFDEHFQITELSRSKSDDKQDEKTEERVNLGRKRSRKRTISKDRRQSLHYEDTMATYLLIQLSKNCEISEEVCKLKEDKPINLSSETPEFLLRIPNEVVVRLFGMLSRNLPSVYGSAELVDMAGIKQLTIQSLMAGNGDLQVAAVLGQKSASYEEDCTLPSMDEDTQILEPDEIAAILPHLPPRVVNHTWIKAFSTDRDGFSLSTFYRKLQNLENPVLLVIEDVEDHVFGSLLSEPPLQTDAFTGTGESWLFSIQNDSENSVEIYHWSKKNELFCKGCPNSLAIGAGDGQFGIWFDQDLNHGRTQACQTFDNPPLAANEDFRVKCIECWTFSARS